jgi:hypothetical protein
MHQRRATDLRLSLQQDGVVLLRGCFAREPLTRLREAASCCFEALVTGRPVPEHYGFTRQSHSVRLPALLDFGIESEQVLTSPLSEDCLSEMCFGLVGGPWRCRLEHSWVRKKFAPRNAPRPGYPIQDWHQDGALGAQFPPEPGTLTPATNLATCWIPLNACGRDSPGLEFIRNPPPALLHFTELDDTALRRRFGPAAFWAPALEFGDGLVFSNKVLHRTHVDADMGRDRISVEYRIFPP